MESANSEKNIQLYSPMGEGFALFAVEKSSKKKEFMLRKANREFTRIFADRGEVDGKSFFQLFVDLPDKIDIQQEIILDKKIKVMNSVPSSGKILKTTIFSPDWEQIAVIVEDITERTKMEEELSVQKAYFQQLFENSPEGIVLLDNTDRVVDVNKGFLKIFRYSREEVIGQLVNDLIVPSWLKNEGSELTGNVLGGEVIRAETTRRRKDGSSVQVAILGYPIMLTEKQVGVFGMYRDITERKIQEKRIHYLSYHDKLTGLYNRTYFEDAVQRHVQEQKPLSIIMGDMNGLKLINDAFGHYQGDLLLKNVARILKENCRDDEIIARWGGDEFAVLMPEVKHKEAVKRAERIKRIIGDMDYFETPVSISLGVASRTEGNEGMHEIIREAEGEMYHNKLMESKSFYKNIVSSLKKTLFEKSNETEEHIKKVREISLDIAKLADISEKYMEYLELLAVLHDIGKIAISENIMKKEGQLDQEEWGQLKKHPEIGYRIAKSLPELAPIADGILSHHEHWDGKGYPRGLKGEEIPIISRIIAIADSFDAMTRKRPGRKVLSRRESIKEIKKEAGCKFDPELVETFLFLIEKK